MKLKVRHEKPAAYHLYYPEDTWTKAFLEVFSTTRPIKSFSVDQLRKLKELGFKIEVIEAPKKIEEIEI